MKYKYNIEIRNESEDIETFEKFKDDIYSYILHEMKGWFDFDIDILVIVKDIKDDKVFVGNENKYAYATMLDDRYTMVFDIKSFKMIARDGGLDIASAASHELAHIYDIYKMMNNKHYFINPLKKDFKTFDEFAISYGWNFWTEFYAYWYTFNKFKSEMNYPTFFKLVKEYESLMTINEKIHSKFDRGKACDKEEMQNFLDRVERFAYSMSKYLVGSIYGKQRYYDYCEKTTNSYAFKKVDKIYDGLINKILPFCKNAYGKGMKRKLYNLGEYILRYVFCEFDLCPIEDGGYIKFAYFTD